LSKQGSVGVMQRTNVRKGCKTDFASQSFSRHLCSHVLP
jgi:hypothetical protein